MEIEGLTGEIRFNDDGRRHNYTLHVVEMTVNSAMVKVNISFSFLFRSISHSPFPSLSLHQFPKCPINHISRSRENRDIAIRLLSFLLPSFLPFFFTILPRVCSTILTIYNHEHACTHVDCNMYLEQLSAIHDLPFKVAEWTDEAGFQAIAAKYIRLRPHAEIEKNKTYIVTTIVVRMDRVCSSDD